MKSLKNVLWVPLWLLAVALLIVVVVIWVCYTIIEMFFEAVWNLIDQDSKRIIPLSDQPSICTIDGQDYYTIKAKDIEPEYVRSEWD